MRRLKRWAGRDVLVVVIGSVAAVLLARGTLAPLFQSAPGEVHPVTIPRGSDVTSIAHRLSDAGVIHSPSMFILLARTLGLDRVLRAGQYQLSSGMSSLDILRLLEKGSDVRVVLPEGLTVTEVADTLERAVGLPPGEFLAAARDSALRARAGDPAPTLEGYLFPDTYDILSDMSAREIVEDATDFAEAAADPDVSTAMSHVYAEPPTGAGPGSEGGA